jgi:hypothetical protein
MREVGFRRGNPDGPSSCIPNSILSQARFNPNESNLPSGFPEKRHSRALGLGLHVFLIKVF